jgi:ABC-type sugar transport system, periplasmic component
MKKLVALLLSLIMLLSCLGALAEYDTPIKLTINSTHSNASMDYNSDNLYKTIAEKFNFEYEVWPVAKDSQAEKIRVWINGGSMPDVATWRDFNYQEYITYAEQGLLAPIPEGWEEKYPNLYKMILATGLYEKMKVDGITYGLPHAPFAHFMSMDTMVAHIVVYYRKDWVDKLGMEPFGYKVTKAQLAEYLEKAIAADLAGNGNTLGLSESPNFLIQMFTQFSGMNGITNNTFYKGETGYEFSLTNPNVLPYIQEFHDWYEKGLIDPDFYLLNYTESANNFTSGISAAMYNSAAVSSVMAYKATFENSTGLNADDCVGIAAIADDNGVTYIDEALNYFSASLFNPNIAPETMDRLLALMDWQCTEEGELTVMLGVKGESWDLDADGNIIMLTTPNESGAYPATVDLYPSFNVFRCMGILKVILSMDTSAEITRLIITPNLDLATEWQNYIDTNKGLWQPVIDDLNAAFYN